MAMTRVPQTPKQILAAQAREAEQRRQAAKPAPTSAAIAPAQSIAAALPDTRTDMERYLDEFAPNTFAGRIIRFNGQRGEYRFHDDGELVPADAEFVALCDEVLVGWIRFHGKGEPPDRIGGLFYQGFRSPKRETLSDPELAGTKEDPWKRMHMVPLQDTQTKDMFAFSTVSDTGNTAVSILLRQYDRLRAKNPDVVPIIRLRSAGFQPTDPQAAYCYKPVLTQIGKGDRCETKPSDTSVGGDMNDEILF
jgi:hypothetical protein